MFIPCPGACTAVGVSTFWGVTTGGVTPDTVGAGDAPGTIGAAEFAGAGVGAGLAGAGDATLAP